MDEEWKKQFPIQSLADLEFVIGQRRGNAVGMERDGPAEFKRRVLAGKLSFEMHLSSIDYTLKRYVKPDLYEASELSLGDEISRFLRDACNFLMIEFKNLHTQGELPLGILGAELTLYRLPHLLDTARMLANRGLLLEVLPLLRLCLEMIAWAHTAFYLSDDNPVFELKAQSCISSLKEIYPSAGKLYGLLSEFAHWGHAIHGEFMHFDADQETVSVVNASVGYRARSLALCLVLPDVCVEVARKIYQEKSESLVKRVQNVGCPDPGRNSCRYVARIVNVCGLSEINEIQSLLP